MKLICSESKRCSHNCEQCQEIERPDELLGQNIECPINENAEWEEC